MLSEADVNALATAQHLDPFSVLGMHADQDEQLWVAAVLPGAHAVSVIEARTSKRVAQMSLRHPNGVFEANMGRRKQRFDYRLRVEWSDGIIGDYADAYSFEPLLHDDDLHYLQEGTHLRPWQVLGAHLASIGSGVTAVNGVRFAVWAPNVKRVSVVGPFNTWDGRRHPMRSRGGAGVWELFIPHVTTGDLYKFELVDRQGDLLPLKADPYARKAQMRPDTASVVSAPALTQPLPAHRVASNRLDAPISIYEVHLSSWRQSESGGFPDWNELAKTLPKYAHQLGFTHIEVLPISEHPFDGSWGYQTLGMFAPTARFGTPEGFRSFVQACHVLGVGVIVDWVPAHFPSDAHGLARFDGTAIYEYADPKEGFHRDWNTLIYNFGRNEVKNFLIGSALYWAEVFGVDGLRVDAVASMLYRDYSRKEGEWIPNVHGGRENLEAIELFKQINRVLGREVRGCMTIAEESTAFPGVSSPTDQGGLGFHFKWNMGWMNDTLRYMQEDPIHRQWHHDKMSFGLVYAFSEKFVLPLSHDEVVHGKGSILGRMPGDEWQRFANLRAYYGFMWGHPGKKLLFMGQEFAQPTEWDHGTQLPWHLLEHEKHVGVQRLVRDLNHLYAKQPALHRLDCDPAGFRWLVVDDAQNSVYAWERLDQQGNAVIVVCNMTPVPRTGYSVGVQHDCKAWQEVLNTDSVYYGGSNLGNGTAPLPVQAVPAHGQPKSIALTLPPLATVFLTAI